MMAIAAGCQSDDLLELPGKIIHVIVAQRGGHLFDRHGGAVQQIAGALHLHMDKVLDGLEDAVQGAMVISLTRAFAVSGNDGKEEDRLEPILDMLQHSGALLRVKSW